jgi:hypothetical protein
VLALHRADSDPADELTLLRHGTALAKSLLQEDA